MKNPILIILISIASSLPFLLRAQAPDLGTLTHFVLFTGAGAVGSTGISLITGDVGADVGAITGFGSISGTVNNGDATTAQAVIDVNAAYNQLFSTPHLPLIPLRLAAGKRFLQECIPLPVQRLLWVI